MTCVIRPNLATFHLAIPVRFPRDDVERITDFSKGLNSAIRYVDAYPVH